MSKGLLPKFGYKKEGPYMGKTTMRNFYPFPRTGSIPDRFNPRTGSIPGQVQLGQVQSQDEFNDSMIQI